MQRFPFRSVRRTRSAGAANEEVTFGAILEPRRYLVTRIAVRDVTSTPTGAITLLVKGHGDEYVIDEVPAPAAGRLYPFPDDVRLFPGETLAARFAGTTAADNLEMHLEGEWWEEPPAGRPADPPSWPDAGAGAQPPPAAYP